jgi:hypothetical protein
MKASFIVHAGLAMLLSAVCLVTALLTFLPGVSLPWDSGAVPDVFFASLFVLLAGAVVRAMALTSRGVRVQGHRRLQWLAVRCLPPAVQAALAGLFVVGAALLAGTVVGGGGPRQADGAENGRYYAVQDDGPHHERVPVSRAEYEDLLAHDQRAMLAGLGLLAAGVAVSTLITAQLHPTTRLQWQPVQGTAPAA